jgi:hypothetical protein
MDSSAIREEQEVLDHQRARIEEILAHKIVSPEMARDLRRRLDYIGRRMSELSVTPPPQEVQSGMFG